MTKKQKKNYGDVIYVPVLRWIIKVRTNQNVCMI